MNLPPRTPAALTALGAVPFVIGAMGTTTDTAFPLFPTNSVETVTHYGIIILSFMTGILWGFAARAETDKAPYAYITSVLPALYTFFFVVGTDANKLTALMVGFALLLALDLSFQKAKLAPPWWITLLVPVTIVVLAALLITRISL